MVPNAIIIKVHYLREGMAEKFKFRITNINFYEHISKHNKLERAKINLSGMFITPQVASEIL